MRVPFSGARQRSAKEEMTPERITQLARRPEGFRVSWRYRDDWLHKRCRRLKEAGVLTIQKGRGETIYRTVNGGRDAG